MGSINLKHTGSGSAIALSSDGTSLLLDGTAIGGGGGGADLYAANESSPTAQPSATGTNSIAIGDSAISTNTNSFALGKSRSIGISSFAANIGNSTTGYGARSNSSIAIGYLASAGTASVCIGYNSTAGGSNSYTIGRNSSGSSYSDTYSFGNDIFASANNQVNIAGAGQDVRISERYTLPKVDGSANEVLTTDGSGAVSWATAGGGSMNLISTQNISSAVSSIDFTSIGSYTRWRVIGSFKMSAGGYHGIKLYDNGSLISGSQYSSFRSTNYGTPSTYNGAYGFLTNTGIKNGFFIYDIEMVDGRPYVKMDVSGQSSDSHTGQKQDNTAGCLVDSYSLTSLTGFSFAPLGAFSTATYNTAKVSLYGIST